MKIIAFGNSRYKRIAHNWALFLQKHEITNYTIISLDQDIYNYLVGNKINTELEINMFDKSRLDWRTRFEYIYSLLNNGTDILHSDLDAVWLHNPLSLIESEYDIVASTGTFPKDVYKEVGYTLCMGWIYYKSSTIVKKLFQNVIHGNTHENFDDQREMNRELFNNSKYKELKLKILDQTIISRGQPYNENTYVAHPLSGKNVDREAFLKNKNLWILE